MKNNKSFKSRILKIIEGQKPTSWGKSIGLNLGVIDRIFRQDVVPKSEHLITISRALNVTVDWLLTGEGEMYSAANNVGKEKKKTEKIITELNKMSGRKRELAEAIVLSLKFSDEDELSRFLVDIKKEQLLKELLAQHNHKKAEKHS